MLATRSLLSVGKNVGPSFRMAPRIQSWLNYISLMLMVVVLPSRVSAPVPSKKPSPAKPQANPPLRGILASLSASSSLAAPVASLMMPLPRAGLAAVVWDVHVVPAAVNENFAPMSNTNIKVILGSMPLKPSYVTCQGRASWLTVAVPPVQVLLTTVARVMWPIRAWMVLWMVDEWKLPSSVTGQSRLMPLVVPRWRLLQTILYARLVMLRSLAEALPTAIESRSAAPRLVSRSLLRVRIEFDPLSEASRWLAFEQVGVDRCLPLTRAP
jgi:hypothetical protein